MSGDRNMTPEEITDSWYADADNLPQDSKALVAFLDDLARKDCVTLKQKVNVVGAAMVAAANYVEHHPDFGGELPQALKGQLKYIVIYRYEKTETLCRFQDYRDLLDPQKAMLNFLVPEPVVGWLKDEATKMLLSCPGLPPEYVNHLKRIQAGQLPQGYAILRGQMGGTH